ncbi:MAG: cystathionine gamma-synthase [Candidatus Thermofonsia Clade 1 bacterium]|uniref:homocysteine desulfhydrase n=1 Tax=Candidatus Thermofonsia Clade 1 bacterium TaxID=2364210 RepID=A0A2M8PCI4_9CHLR|nr:MAG: cystathionine gamma-synthase [Candidatus Thermofonsia Clade 1 bacterium]RMF50357.1 MAG: PLP-dependent transferase [Chloroflexota bacterium]
MPRAGINTLSVHGGDDRPRAHQAIPMPIIQTATYAFADTADLINFMQHKSWGDGIVGREEYGRYGNPTVQAVESKVAALEGAEDAVLFSSGMAAITSLLLASLPTGAHLVMTSDCYRRTRQFCLTFLKRLGIETTIVPTGDYEALEAAIQPKRTRFILSESPTNPYLRCVDFERLAEIAKRHRVQTIIDSTFGTPVNQLPLQYGIDYVTHSATKYLGGHHDLLAGVVAARKDRIAALRDARGVLGGIVDPQNAYLLERGLKTLGLRVTQQNATAMRIAEYLEAHPKIERVWYPGLPSHPDHEIAKKQMRGFGGVVSFTVRGTLEETSRFIDAMQIPYIAPSLGGVDSLIEQPALMSYFEKTPEERLEVGITGNLVRFAIGVEDAEDLIADLEQALRVLP